METPEEVTNESNRFEKRSLTAMELEQAFCPFTWRADMLLSNREVETDKVESVLIISQSLSEAGTLAYHRVPSGTDRRFC